MNVYTVCDCKQQLQAISVCVMLSLSRKPCPGAVFKVKLSFYTSSVITV